MKRFLSSLLLLCGTAFGQSIPNGAIVQGQAWTPAQWNAAWASKRDLASINDATNARNFGVLCNGVTDDSAALTAAIAAVPAGGSLYIPPSATMCELSADIVVNKAMTVFAQPGSVFLQAKTGNASNPVLLDITASNVTISGLGLDGGGTAFANANPVAKDEAGANGVLFTQLNVQNTRGFGIGILAVTNSGVTYSNFNNIGMLWATSLLAADRHQAIVFTNATGVKNYAIGNYFKNIGLDAISGTGQTGWVVAENRCDLSTAQDAQAFGNWPACVFGLNNTGVNIIGNVSDSAPGNGIDMGSPTSGLNIVGNYVTGSGGSGVALSGISNFSVTGNTLVGNGLNTTACGRDGVDLLDAETSGTIGGNVSTGNGQFGAFAFTACSHPATLTNVILDPSNMLAGNTAGTLGGGLSVLTGQVLSGTTGSIGGGALAAGACASGTASVTGATTSMVADASPNTYPGDGDYWNARVSAAGTVTVKVCAVVAQTPAASTYSVRVLQ